jgi:hypothetical protein
MARGGLKTPANNRSPVRTRSFSDSIVVYKIATTSENEPVIPLEQHCPSIPLKPTTPLSQRPILQEILQKSHQS